MSVYRVDLASPVQIYNRSRFGEDGEEAFTSALDDICAIIDLSYEKGAADAFSQVDTLQEMYDTVMSKESSTSQD